MVSSFLFSFQFPCAFAFRRLQFSFFRFRALAHAVSNVARLLVVVTCWRNSCSCCWKRISSCWRRSSISSSSCSNSNYGSRSHRSVSFLALRFLSSISSICLLLDDRELAILGCFLLFSASLCSRMPGRDLDVLLSVFFSLHFLYQLQFHLGLRQQPMWLTLTIFGFHKPCWACTVWSGTDSNSYNRWNSQTFGCELLALLFESILCISHLAFLLALPIDYRMSVFESRLSFLTPAQTVHYKFVYELPLICTLVVSTNSVRSISMSRRKGTISTTNRKTLLFSFRIRLVSLLKISNYFGFKSNLCHFLFSSSSS